MDSQNTSSFIPKKTMVPGGAFPRSSSLFSFVANLIFVVAIISLVVVFLYQKYLEGQISQMSANLSSTRVALQPNVISELSRSDARIISANELLNKHVALSDFFALLQSLTLQNLRFTSFSYSENAQGVLSVSMKGQAPTYATVAVQENIFNGNSNFINPTFSNLDLDDKGNVVFDFQSQLNPKVVSYKEQFDAANGGAVATPPASVSSPASPATTATPATTTTTTVKTSSTTPSH
jgi:hypothetical protein